MDNLNLYYTIKDMYDNGEISVGELATDVQKMISHFNDAITDYLKEINDDRKSRNKDEIKKLFSEQINKDITYEIVIEAERIDTDINFNESYKIDQSIYTRDGNTQNPDFGTRFKEVFNDNKLHNDKMAVLNRIEWFWEYIRENEDTAKLEDVLRYLFNTATDSNDYGSFTDEEIEDILSMFNSGALTQAGLYGDSVEENVWFALKAEGYSDNAVAGAMGNIYAESGFDPAIIEKGSGAGFGLCQWTGGRRTKLEAYAFSKGVEASDLQTQLEFLITELKRKRSSRWFC